MMTTRRDLCKSLLATSALALWPTIPVVAQSRDNTARIAWPYDTASLDAVGIGAQRSTWSVSLHLYDRLVTYAATDRSDGTRQYDPARLRSELAESWQVSPDSRTVTFRLRPDARFHDGSPVTAEDVRWSIERALTVKSAAGVMAVGGLKSADQLKAVDATTFQVTLPAPNRFAVLVFTIPFAAIINSKLANQNATAQDPWANEWLKRNAAGGGAYKLESFRNDQVLLTRNESWTCGDKPGMQQVIFQTVPESATRGALVERGAADIAVEIPPNDFAAIEGRGQARALAIPMPNHMDLMAANSQAAPFDDLRVRQAIAYALPYQQIFQSVFRGRGTPLFGAKGEPKPASFPQPSDFNTDPDRAMALLKDAGRAGGFEANLMYSVAKAAYFDPLSLVVRDALGKIGIRVNIDRIPGAQFDERVVARNFQLLLDNRVAWLSLPDYWFTAFYTGTSTSNLGNFNDPKLDRMLKDLPGDASPELYGERTAEMSRLVLTEVPMIPLRQGAVELVMSRGLSGYTYWFHGLPDARDLRRA
ncbi:MAG: ABC transporter substrate-binding protein [Bradyrhizobium sp.]|uniref:ABC transporter substrate-binding protein n=1 Tax=Bradyrhizobium sp. TaxID=376 RepID=UPI001D56E1E5|nr:ABC transporter substrate-binding protein [Bradyrhizobium sp.]MBV9559439.1 ABC transporter substrate-binding protein [Bradyrhizobium sp.]